MSSLIYDNSSSIPHHAVCMEAKEEVASNTIHHSHYMAYLDNCFSSMRCLPSRMEVEEVNFSNNLCHFYRSLFFSQLCASTYPCLLHLFPNLIKVFCLLYSFILYIYNYQSQLFS